MTHEEEITHLKEQVKYWQDMFYKYYPVYDYIVLRKDDMVVAFKRQRSKPEEMDEESHLQYYYESGTCPVNYLGVEQVFEVKDNTITDIDPHGIFTYIGVIYWEELKEHICEISKECDDEWLIPKVQEKILNPYEWSDDTNP